MPSDAKKMYSSVEKLVLVNIWTALILLSSVCQLSAVNGKCGFETDVNNYSLLLFLFNNLNSLINMFTLWTLIEASLLCLNAVCILHEERFLAKCKFP